MIDDLQPYSSYAAHEHGPLPTHWRWEPLRRLGTIAGGMTPSMANRSFWDGDIPWVTPKDMKVARISGAQMHVARPALAQTPLRLLPSGSVLLVVRGMILAKRVPVAVTQLPVTINQDMKAIRPHDSVSGEYLALAMEACSESLMLCIDEAGHGTRRLPTERWRALSVPLPPPEEQSAIVRFLDHTNRRIERYIRGKRKLIALLNEQKQAIIHRAVTRGLDPNVPMKDSGMSWLGEIPAHWALNRLKTMSVLVTSGSRGWAKYYAESGALFLRIGNISTTSIDLRLGRLTYVNPPAASEGERTRVCPGDVLLSITAQIGAVGVVPPELAEAFVNQHTALIRPNPAVISPRWMAYVLLSSFGKNQCRLLTNGGTKVGLTLDDVRCLHIISPPLCEQERLVMAVEARCADLDAALSRAEREIALMREYRTRLVSDIVTGQLDVREAARNLPDLDPETNVLDTPEPDEDSAPEDDLEGDEAA